MKAPADLCHSSGSLVAGPVGPAGLALLRRIRMQGGSHRLSDPRERDAAQRALRLGFVVCEGRNRDLIHLTGNGRAFLDRLMRAH